MTVRVAGGGGAGSWKDSVATVDVLPTTGNTVGDTRLVRADSAIYAWTSGSGWVLTAGSGVGGGGTGGGGGGGVPSVVPVIGTSVAELNALYSAPPGDGSEGLIQIGNGLDESFVHVVWDLARSKWVSDEFIAIRCTDQNGPNIGFYARTQLGRDPSTGEANPTNYSWSSTNSPRRVNAMISAGLGMEYRHHGWMIRDPGGVRGNVGSYIYGVAAGEPISSGSFAQPPTGGVLRTPVADDMHEGGPNNTADYQWAAHNWNTMEVLGAVTKTAIHAIMVGNLDNDPAVTGNAAVIDYALILRFAG